MKIIHLVIQEIKHRKLNALLGVLGVAIAVGVSVGAIGLLKVHDVQTEKLLTEKQQEVEARTKQYNDDVRKMTKRMGFNVVILPKDQDLTDIYTANYATKFMPEAYADKLANSKIVTVNHLLPSLEQRIQWTERNDRTMILIGIKGQVPIAHRDPKKPIMDTVPVGEIILGHELARTEDIKLNDELTLLGKTFKVTKIHEPRGDKQDITAWINLGTAQELLNKQGQINAIWALDCRCAWADLGKVRTELQAILPDTQILQDRTKALARAEARQSAIDEAKAALETEATSRQKMRDEQERFAAILTPITVFAGAIWMGLIALMNVRERKQELGVLRALGYGSWDIQLLFLLKAVGISIIGALIGYALGLIIGGGIGSDVGGLEVVFNAVQMLGVFALAIVLAIAATWLPAQLGAQQDPAAVLREE